MIKYKYIISYSNSELCIAVFCGAWVLGGYAIIPLEFQQYQQYTVTFQVLQ